MLFSCIHSSRFCHPHFRADILSAFLRKQIIKESAENTDERIGGVEDIEGVMNRDKVGTSRENKN
jgi:hypothetical protein